MRSTGARLGILAAAVAAAVVLFIVLDSGSDGGSDDGGGSDAADATTTPAETMTTAAPEVLMIRDGEPVGGVRSLTYEKGERVNLEVRLNRREEEIHVHGYEITKSAETSPVRLSFPARIDGIFDIEVHRTDGIDAQIAELRVNP
jgi:hypothetical protein